MSSQNPRLERSNKSGKKGKAPKARKKKKLTVKKLLWTSFFTIAFAVFCAIAGYMYITVSGEKALRENEDKLTVYETTKVYDRNGALMGELSIDKSEPVDSSEIPDLLKKAFVATEDRRFFEHNGVDLWSIGRAAVKDIVARSLVEGGSTITQQLAKNIFLSADKTFFRKATEMSIAMALERHKTKDEILMLYLNRINFGGTVYGIKAASIRYFGKSNLNDLKLWEIATLAAMPKGPSKYNPLRNPELSQERRAVVLDLMYQEGYITAEQRDEAKKVAYDYEPPASNQSYLAFKDYVVEEAEEKFGLTEDELNRGGYKIYTTMDAQAQKAVEKAFANDDYFEKSKDDKQVQGSIVIMNHENGSLVALLGGRDYERKGYSRLNSRRQPGSAFKPIVSYAPALESGKFTPDSQIPNNKQSFGNYSPTNMHGYSNTINLTTALTKSENIPAVWLLNEVGVGTGVKYAQEMGIKMDKNDRNLAIALGGLTYGTNTLEMAGAFSVFANGGEYNPPYSIKQIVDHNGVVKYKYNPAKPKRVISEQTAYYMTKMMENVVNEGTGRRAKIDRPVAGKTGTTQHGIPGLRSSKNRDVWFVGYTPEWTAAVWMGYDNPDKDHLLNGSSGQTAALFAAVMKEALAGVPVKDFPVPANLKPPAQEETKTAAPSELSAAYNADTGTVALSWKGVEQPGAVYRIYRREASETEFTRIMDSSATETEDISITPGTGYIYYVTAYDPVNDAESEHSNNAQVLIEAGEDPMDDLPDPGVGGDGNQGQSGDGQIDDGSGNQGFPSGNGDGQGNGQGNGNGNGQGNGHGNGNGQGNGNGNNGNGSGNGDGGVSIPGTVVPPDGSSGEGNTDTFPPPADGTNGQTNSGDGVDAPVGTNEAVQGTGG
ncbi:PBP1A family penicillin-binding protein [Paenibacillus macerans]|uniref:PBP1A family penicillin-binding protein n=1 Tax=Paenibacillus macerans TaxID=44252 RepID=UPI00203FF26E|nr:PBP1A family penicillin-binding protein [Paenibacillus macerans]MCM3702760.1 PBP1A family penicillin-binding protein [Paenibacillus macerans]